jgi:hypothetical protein
MALVPNPGIGVISTSFAPNNCTESSNCIGSGRVFGPSLGSRKLRGDILNTKMRRFAAGFLFFNLNLVTLPHQASLELVQLFLGSVTTINQTLLFNSADLI